MKILRGLTKGVEKTISILTKLYGVQADIYLPVNYKDQSRGFVSNDIEYNDEPEFSQKILFPFIFKFKNKTMGVVDELFPDDDKVIYLYKDIMDLPKFSKIVFSTIDGYTQFIINDVVEIKDDEQIILRKAYLIPDMSFDDENKEYLEERLEDIIDLDGVEDGAELDMNTINTYDKDESLKENETIVYQPIE